MGSPENRICVSGVRGGQHCVRMQLHDMRNVHWNQYHHTPTHVPIDIVVAAQVWDDVDQLV